MADEQLQSDDRKGSTYGMAISGFSAQVYERLYEQKKILYSLPAEFSTGQIIDLWQRLTDNTNIAVQ